MSRDEAPPFERGGTYSGNAATVNPTPVLGLGGVNLEGKEFIFEPDSSTVTQSNKQTDPTGRAVRVRVVRNDSAVNLKPGRLVKYEFSATNPIGSRVDGYATSVNDPVAGVVDEYLPLAGVAPNDLFFIVTRGPTVVTQGATTAATIAVGSRLVAAAYGATAGDDLGGRVALQDLSGATTPLGNNIQNRVGRAASANTTAGQSVNAYVEFSW